MEPDNLIREEPVMRREPKVSGWKRCGKRFFKFVSVGPLDNGLYFKRKQQYVSVCSGIFTIIGVLGLLAITLKVFIDILNHKVAKSSIKFE